ncbi:hypothetical protein [Winogradskyella sp. PE311]|uniref:hypothetical protein n=1 Tax=Winogradskyella sp. PE311 TaxID=3366943 RepID=UPI00398153F8
MKKLITLAVILILVACKSETNKDETIQQTAEKTTQVEASKKATEQSTNKDTYLCKINGKNWAYTRASGIISRHKKTNKREAIFTFTKQIGKAKETVQLFYDGDTNQLEQVNIHLKVPKTDGKKMTAMYIYHPNTGKFHPDAKISGTIDLSNPSNASGNAEVSDLDVRFDKAQVKNDADTRITVEDLNFSGIGYSEAGKLFGSKGTSSTN